MEREYEYLLSVLGDYPQGRRPKAAQGVDWEKLVQLSQIHCVTGILGSMAMQYPICPNDEIKAGLRQVCLSTMAMFAQRAKRMEELICRMEQAGIQHILMKGYVLREYYPVPELRTYGDIDFVIRQSDREKSDGMMMELGFHREADWEPVYSYTRDMEYYEVHADIMEVDVSDRADYRGYFRQMWQHIRPGDEFSCQFTPEFHFLYLLTHIAKHIRGSGAGARMYLDIAVFIRHFEGKLDWESVQRELRKLELYDFACVVLEAVEQWFGVSSPMPRRPVAQEVMTEFVIFTMEAGVYGYFHRESGISALKQTGQTQSAARGKLVLQRWFPPAAQISNRYTYLQKRPWLLPVAWVHRVVKNRKRIGEEVHDTQVILSADTGEVSRLQKLQRDIGL